MSASVGFGTLSGAVPEGASASATYRDLIELAVTAEQVGFDSVWVSEHHGTHNGHNPSPLVLLAAMAASTECIGLGTGIAIGSLQSPLRFAEDAAVTDQISGGRLTIGLGPGWRPSEFSAFGVPMDQRAGRTDELVDICREAWTGAAFDHEGTHFRIENGLATPPPAHRIKLYLVGEAPGAIRRAGARGDGYFANGIPHVGQGVLAERVELLDSAAAAAGRSASDIALCFSVNAWASTDRDPPAKVIEALWTRIAVSNRWHRDARPDDGGPLPSPDMSEIGRRSWLGTPAEIVAQAKRWLAPYRDRDTEILFRLHHPGLPADMVAEQLELFGRTIIPALHEARR